jgi:glycosyltransferase involved in cell wall biosynthesis
MGPVLSEQADGKLFRDQHGLGAAPLVLFLGRKYAYKGVAALLAAAPKVWDTVPEARFAFVGPRTAYSVRLFGERQDRAFLNWIRWISRTRPTRWPPVICCVCHRRRKVFGGVYTEHGALASQV